MPDDASEDYKVRYVKEQERLAKLWDAYEALEKDFTQSNEEILKLKEKLKGTEEELGTLKEVLDKRDEEIRNLDVKLTKMKNIQNTYEPKIEKLEESLEKEREKLAKLFEISEEMEQELDISRQGIAARDNWFMHNVEVFDRLCKSIRDRRAIIKGKFLEYGVDLGKGKSAVHPEKKTPVEEKKEKPAARPAGDRDSVIETFQKLDDVDFNKASALYEAGFTTIEALKDAKKYELVGVKGITPTLAASIVKQAREL